VSESRAPLIAGRMLTVGIWSLIAGPSLISSTIHYVDYVSAISAHSGSNWRLSAQYPTDRTRCRGVRHDRGPLGCNCNDWRQNRASLVFSRAWQDRSRFPVLIIKPHIYQDDKIQSSTQVASAAIHGGAFAPDSGDKGRNMS